MNSDNIYAVGIDIGTDTIKVVVGRRKEGESDENPHFTIIGAGRAKTKGMRKGVVVNTELVASSLDKALVEADRMSGYKFSEASVSINGSHIMGLSSQGVVAVTNGGEIKDDEVERAMEAAKVVQIPPNREILDTTARSYKLDSQEKIRDPIGMTGIRLEVDAYIITALTPNLDNLYRVLDMTEIKSNVILPSSIALKKVSLTDQQCENGVVCIDFGATTTNIAVYEEGDIIHTAVLPVGSANITNDLAIGLKTDLNVAEKVKVDHAVAAPELRRGAEGNISVKVGDFEYTFSAELVDEIVEARLAEIFTMVNKELKKVKKFANLPGGAVIVGGGARLRGIADYAREILQMNAVFGKSSHYDGMTDKINGPEFATALGLMECDASVNSMRRDNSGGGFGFGGLSGFFAKFTRK